MNKWFFKRILMSLCFMLTFHAVNSATPVWTVEPLTPTHLAISPTGHAIVKYLVTNRSAKTHTLQMTPITGVTQFTLPGNCPSPLTLTTQQSCVLTLGIHGSLVVNDIIGGPRLCQGGNPLQCYQPSAANSLHITLNRQSHTVGGLVAGLTGTVVLANNGTDLLPVTGAGPFVFSNPVAVGGIYHVTVATQPAGQLCSVSNGTGIMGNSNVTNVTVTCSANSFTVGGNVAGLVGTVVLQNNNADTLIVNANGSFTFPTPVAQGSLYNVTVQSQPLNQICTVSNGTGIILNSNITNVQVTCSSSAFTVGGTVSGLLGGTFSLRLNGEPPITISANGPYSFPTLVAQGSVYVVTIPTQPPGQTCTLSNNFGLMGGANVTNVNVTCTLNQNTVGGAVSGLIGTVVLQNNGADNLSISSDGSFTFSTPVAVGSPYNVTVLTQPAGQTCTVSNGTGIMGLTSVTNVVVVCASNTYTIGGNLSGLTGGSVTLLRNGQEPLILNANGAFVFPTAVADGSFYLVTIQTQPAGQVCTASNNFGRVNGANVTNIAVVCSATSHTVGGSVSGLTGGTLVLQNNNTDTLLITANGQFTFPTPIATGSSYSVTIQTQPAGQFCTVSNGTGIMGTSNVTNVFVGCSPNQTTITAGSAVIPVNAGNGLLTITNTGYVPATNVRAILPAGWTEVTQDASACAVILPGASCQLIFTSPVPYIAQKVEIASDNATLYYIPQLQYAPAIAFSIDGYLVWSVDSTTVAKVLQDTDNADFSWDSAQPCCTTTNATSSTNGAYLDLIGNTYMIISGPNAIGTQAMTGGNAAASCYNIVADNTGAVPNGTWFLPSVCQNASSPGTGCNPGFPNIGTLSLLGFANMSDFFWSSTEVSNDAAYVQAFSTFPSSTQINASTFSKGHSTATRCARSITY